MHCIVSPGMISVVLGDWTAMLVRTNQTLQMTMTNVCSRRITVTTSRQTLSSWFQRAVSWYSNIMLLTPSWWVEEGELRQNSVFLSGELGRSDLCLLTASYVWFQFLTLLISKIYIKNRDSAYNVCTPAYGNRYWSCQLLILCTWSRLYGRL